MELGSVILKRSSINSLFKAVHSRHGLAWTDGQNVYLSPIVIENDSLKQAERIKLGEFDVIQSLCWSCDFSGGWCYLCVTQHQKISIWRVEGSTPNLKLKLVRKISKNPLPQGCLWNPVRDILAIATAEQCNLYFRHSDKKSSLALPIQTQNGALRSACWSEQGDRLYVATNSSIWLFAWPNIDSKIKEFSSEESLLNREKGNILTMVAIGRDYVLITRELPLERLLTQQDFHIDMAQAMQSPKYTLMNLAANQSAEESSASLALIATSGSVMKVISDTNIKGLLAPDLLSYAFDGSQQLVVAGSNTQSTLQFFTISGLGTLDKQHDIMLPDNERPKGLCKTSGSESVYILIGKLKNTDSALLSVESDAAYDLKLSFTKLYPCDSVPSETTELATPAMAKINNISTSPQVIEEFSSSGDNFTLPKVSNIRESDVAMNRVLSNSQPVLHSSTSQRSDSPSLSTINNESSVSLQAAGINDRLQNDINGKGNLTAGSDTHSSWRNITRSDDSFVHDQTEQDPDSSSPTTVHRNESLVTEQPDLYDPLDANIESLAEVLNHQEMTISRLRKRVDELSNMLEECHMISVNRYQDLSNPEVACLSFSAADKKVVERKFLLDRGRLKLDILKTAFESPYLILYLDGLPIVLTENIDGYIPLKFETGSTYHVSCDLMPPGSSQSSSNNQTSNTESPERPGAVEKHLFNGLSPATSRELNHTDSSKAASSHTGKGQHSSESKAERLKLIIQNDKSGNAMRRLQAAAASRGANAPFSVTQRIGDPMPSEEPVKPPRRGAASKNTKAARGDDGSSFMDVTAAI